MVLSTTSVINKFMKLLDVFPDHFIMEDLEGQKVARGKWIKDNLGPKFRGIPMFSKPEDLDQLIDAIGEADPSRNGIYMPWLAKLLITKPQENRAEDLSRVSDDLRTFEANKRQIERKDINQYKSFQDLFDVIAPFLAPRELSQDEAQAAKQRAEDERIKKQLITVYNGPEGWIRIPTTQDSANWIGRNTRWCTASGKNNMFDHYNRSDNLFVVYDKATKARHQLHIDSGQFASEDDRNQGMNAVPDWARQPILDYYKANNPSLSLRQVMTLSTFGDENLAKGTPHEELLDLMRIYQV